MISAAAYRDDLLNHLYENLDQLTVSKIQAALDEIGGVGFHVSIGKKLEDEYTVAEAVFVPTLETVFVLLNPRALDDYAEDIETWAYLFTSHIIHELIHIEQVERSNGKAKPKYELGEVATDAVAYLSDISEIAPHAKDAVDQLATVGLELRQALKLLNVPAVEIYRENLYHNKKVWNRFLKNIYMYAEEFD
jgi:hypothetical protein